MLPFAACWTRLMTPVVTLKFTPLLGTPATVTTTGPVVAPFGTVMAMQVSLQPAGQALEVVSVAMVPFTLTVLDPCVAPKCVPVIVIAVPTPPESGERFVMPGDGLPPLVEALKAAISVSVSLLGESVQVPAIEPADA